MDKQIIYNLLNKELPDTDNKVLYNVAGILYSQMAKWNKEQKKAAVNEIKSKYEAKEAEKTVEALYSDEEASERFLNHLKQKAAEGDFDAALAGKIMDAFGIKAKDRDITVNIVSFKDVYPEEADVYATTAAIIEKKIEEANEELHH